MTKTIFAYEEMDRQIALYEDVLSELAKHVKFVRFGLDQCDKKFHELDRYCELLEEVLLRKHDAFCGDYGEGWFSKSLAFWRNERRQVSSYTRGKDLIRYIFVSNEYKEIIAEIRSLFGNDVQHQINLNADKIIANLHMSGNPVHEWKPSSVN